MAISITAIPTPPYILALERLAERRWRPALFGAAIVLGLATRLLFGRDTPLWFDETFTGVIAGQANLAGLVGWLRTELTGPLFYAPLWLWAKVAGVGNAALRLPSLILSLAAPALILWRGHPDRDVRLFWGAATLLWLPAPILAHDARPYALLFLLGCAQGIAFVAALKELTTRRMLAWTAITTLMGLTHYWALLIGLVQGLIVVGTQPRRALTTWPALAPFAVLLAWMAVHLPFVLGFVGGYAGSTPMIGWAMIVSLPAVLAGTNLFAGIALAAVAFTVAQRLRSRAPVLTIRMPAPETWLGLSGIAAILSFFVIGIYMPGFATRYLLPSCPALLFGLAWWAYRACRVSAAAVMAAFLAMIVGATGIVASSFGRQSPDQRHSFNLEQPSTWLMQRPLGDVMFVWTDPNAERSSDAHMTEVASFFFRRAGSAVPVRVLHVPRGVDATRYVLAAARPGSAILWGANQPHVEDRRNPRIEARDARWECRDFGNGLAINTACRRR